MSGHSKWATIKRKKGKADLERGRIFTRLIREITAAARQGGDPEANPRLRTAVAAAKTANMPQDNIERAIKKGTGELPGVTYEEVTYEGYGPNGVAILVEALTDNKNRTTSELRHLFSRHGGNLGSVGCVSWMFEHRGIITIDQNKCDEDCLLALALEAGAEDVRSEDGTFEIITSPANFEKVKKSLETQKIEWINAELTKVPQSNVPLEGKDAEQMLKLMEAIETCEDVQKVYANFDIPEVVMEQIASSTQ
ncbi:MAG: YebC/PmpR family DNA-binding transcriptional regulator [Candidatus Edwardsbacteria bacterium]